METNQKWERIRRFVHEEKPLTLPDQIELMLMPDGVKLAGEFLWNTQDGQFSPLFEEELFKEENFPFYQALCESEFGKFGGNRYYECHDCRDALMFDKPHVQSLLRSYLSNYCYAFGGSLRSLSGLGWQKLMEHPDAKTLFQICIDCKEFMNFIMHRDESYSKEPRVCMIQHSDGLEMLQMFIDKVFPELNTNCYVGKHQNSLPLCLGWPAYNEAVKKGYL